MLSPDALAAVVREVEAHASESGWDQPARLFALVPTAELAQAEPELAQRLGLAPDSEGLTPIDQELRADANLESELTAMTWPEAVVGCAAVVERLVLPPSAQEQLPDDPTQAVGYAAQHPERQEMRMVAAAIRGGTTYCAYRFRSHDDAASVVGGPDLVPALLELLQATLAEGPEDEETL